MEFAIALLVALIVTIMIVAGFELASSWTARQEEQERLRRAGEAERQRTELRAAMLQFQAETSAAAHEARRALIAEALRYGRRRAQASRSTSEDER